ncbi:hypothetical protein H7J88_03260 [Mycolicibacterium flavescens]|uniref:DUF202 domain-containing protein n=1 Tax=Mycolicibacterium flavescens TaxID=1776 RepID=A0A1E3RCX7_MYCFV|nr:hypothetical protein [Mycolicibacterium flavescens]MCV7278663.1 hypothetical protein [Mycolicibacterium flavescens]ODQ87292.1 hypothetical protein BHQ18_24255 [Mycolicibacterium flavescens]
MTTTHLAVQLAQGGTAEWTGPAVRAALFTSAGVAFIVVGVRRRLARARWNRDDDRRLLNPDAPSDDHRPSAPPSGGTWLVVAGAVLTLLGLLHILDLAATLRVSGLI